MSWINDLCRCDHPVIGMIHIKPLPSTYSYVDDDDAMDKVIKKASDDYNALVDGGVSAVLFCNEFDKPYVKKASEHVISAMTYIVAKIIDNAKKIIPYGIDIQWDPKSSLAIAKITKASFIRGIVTGVYVGDLGMYSPDTQEIMRYRKEIGAEKIKIITNLCPEFSMSLDTRDLELRALTVSKSTMVDAVAISGVMAGSSAPYEQIEKVKAKLADFPVFANTGVNFENISSIAKIADCCCVATCIKKDGISNNGIDKERVKRLMSAIG